MLCCVGISGLRLLGYWLISVGRRWILVVLGYEGLFTFWLGYIYDLCGCLLLFITIRFVICLIPFWLGFDCWWIVCVVRVSFCALLR